MRHLNVQLAQVRRGVVGAEVVFTGDLHQEHAVPNRAVVRWTVPRYPGRLTRLAGYNLLDQCVVGHLGQSRKSGRCGGSDLEIYCVVLRLSIHAEFLLWSSYSYPRWLSDFKSLQWFDFDNVSIAVLWPIQSDHSWFEDLLVGLKGLPSKNFDTHLIAAWQDE